MAADRTAAPVLAGVLSAAGVGAVYGRPLADLPVTSVGDASVALLLAHAHRAVAGTVAAAHLGDGAFVVPGASPEGGPLPEQPPARVEIDDVADLMALAPALAEAAQGRGLRVQIDLDVASRVPAGAPSLAPAPVDPSSLDAEEHELLGVLELTRDAAQTVVLAGPGVLARDEVGGLRALAAAGRLGVLNTWGAKGVFHWQSRHHVATVGLQERDFELAGLPQCDLVLVTGLDEREAPRRLWGSFPHRVVAPECLGALAERWPTDGEFAPMPALRERLAAVTQAGWSVTSVPLMPTLVTRSYARVLGHGGLIASDPGTAGFWVARTFTTTRLGSAFVPAAPLRGWAAACVLVSRLLAPLRPALAVVDGPLDEPTNAVLAEAARLGVGVGIEAWQDDGEAHGPDEHLARLPALAGPDSAVATLRTDPRQFDEMVEAAGPVRAWSGDEARLSGGD
jgi:hypothetical protein